MMGRIHLILTLLFVFSCGKQQDIFETSESVSELRYITIAQHVSGLVAAVKKPRMSICLNSIAGRTSRAIWEERIKEIVLKWVQPLRRLTSDELTQTVNVVKAPTPCDATVNIKTKIRAYALPGRHPKIYSVSGSRHDYNTLLHEFGHAFALGDTYAGFSGECKRGQPQSVMCNISLSELQSDDIKGVSAVFRRTFPNDKPKAGNPENLVEEREEHKQKRGIFVALSENRPETRVWFAVVPMIPHENGTIHYCLASLTSCRSGSALWHVAGRVNTDSTKALYRSRTKIKPTDHGLLTTRYQTGNQTYYQTVRFLSKTS